MKPFQVKAHEDWVEPSLLPNKSFNMRQSLLNPYKVPLSIEIDRGAQPVFPNIHRSLHEKWDLMFFEVKQSSREESKKAYEGKILPENEVLEHVGGEGVLCTDNYRDVCRNRSGVTLG